MSLWGGGRWPIENFQRVMRMYKPLCSWRTFSSFLASLYASLSLTMVSAKENWWVKSTRTCRCQYLASEGDFKRYQGFKQRLTLRYIKAVGPPTASHRCLCPSMVNKHKALLPVSSSLTEEEAEKTIRPEGAKKTAQCKGQRGCGDS